ncbi:hypothetical protein AB3N60_01205 [Leptospira sp. WS39.C2]
MEKLQYRKGKEHDLFQFQELFVESILNVCNKDYTEAQLNQ